MHTPRLPCAMAQGQHADPVKWGGLDVIRQTISERKSGRLI